MDLSLEEYIDNANLLFQENELDKAIENYEAALKLAVTSAQQINLCNALGSLYQKTKNPQKAINVFNISIGLYDESPDENSLPDKATIYNNLATVYLSTNPALAIENYLKALKIYTALTDSENSAFYPHLANTHFALGEAFQHKEDLFNSKTHLKAAIILYDQLPEPGLNELKASAHYHLGNIFTEEFNLYDAQTHYTKSLMVFQNLSENSDVKFKPFKAAVLNNLGVTYKSMEEHQKALDHYEQALDEYQYLSTHNNALFIPYAAATLNSLSILYAEMKNFPKAIEYSHQTAAVYNNLADEFPEEYTHYLATSLHNLGLFYFELKTIESAKKYFIQALHIRKKLAKNEPEAFDADVCATALNLVELYQTQLEDTLDLNYKKLSLELLDDVSKRLQKYSEHRPVLMSMKSDCRYYLEYFNRISLEQLQLEYTYKKIQELTGEIHSTILPKEKIVFQELIVSLLEEQLEHFPQNDKLKNMLPDAYNNLSWMHLQLNNPKSAEAIILKAEDLDQSFSSLQCNLAHSYLLQGRFEEAKTEYKGFFDKNTDEKQAYIFTILSDLEKLENNGVQHKDFERIKELFT
ncbi:MAG TPA: tetratricopeptide repeat protein [Gillisia sp.]|nr:tetratricopeptide repeat protein [Gillisia sp.]